jgi:CYTH domain-containing protein
MGVEIERKFLVNDEWKNVREECTKITIKLDDRPQFYT